MPDIAFSNICSGVGGGWVHAKNNAYFGLSAKSLSVGPSVAKLLNAEIKGCKRNRLN